MNTRTQPTLGNVAEYIRSIVKTNQHSRNALAEAMIALLKPLPVGATIKIKNHEIRREKIYCRCTQWGEDGWGRLGEGDGYLLDGKLISSPDGTFWDGCDFQYRQSGYFLRKYGWHEGDGTLKLALASDIRAVADFLPGAITAYLFQLEEETETNWVTTETITGCIVARTKPTRISRPPRRRATH
jgi:hypothetical protein